MDHWRHWGLRHCPLNCNISSLSPADLLHVLPLSPLISCQFSTELLKLRWLTKKQTCRVCSLSYQSQAEYLYNPVSELVHHNISAYLHRPLCTIKRGFILDCCFGLRAAFSEHF